MLTAMTTARTTTRDDDAIARRADWSSIAVVALLLGIGAGVGAAHAAQHEAGLADDGVGGTDMSMSITRQTDALPAEVDTTHLDLTAATLGAEPRPAVPPGPRASAGWVAAVAHATGIPGVAVQAYADATLALAVERPTCRVGWTTLAALGGIESGHGTHGGAVLLADGRTSARILGPALDGRPGFAAIRATPESTAWHGDPTWDHAVGPLQFLPSTWEVWGADGDGDGVADPNDVDDAALAAARYLCAKASDLTGAEAWHAAVYSYNHSEQYVADALSAANRYAAAALAARSAG